MDFSILLPSSLRGLFRYYFLPFTIKMLPKGPGGNYLPFQQDNHLELPLSVALKQVAPSPFLR